MKTEASLLQAIANASTLSEQATLVAQLDALRAASVRRVQDDRDLDFSSAIVEQTLQPVLTHSLHTAATDWLSEAPIQAVDANAVHAEASMWFGRVASFVKEDAEEFAEQARGYAHRYASQFGDDREAAERAFLDYVAFLNKEGASGLPQIQQLIDGNNQPATTQMPEDVFDNFAPPVDPQNVGIDEAQSSENAELLNDILRAGQGEGQPEVGYQHGEYETNVSQPAFPMKSAAVLDNPSMALGYVMNLDDFRLQQQAALQAQAGEVPEAFKEHQKTKATDADATEDADLEKEAASTLPQVQQLVDSFENPDRKPLPEEVAFPLLPFMQQQMTTAPDGDNPKPKTQASRKQADMFGNTPGVAVQPANPASDNPLLGHTLNGEDKKVDEPTNAMSKAVTHKDAARQQDFAKGFAFAAAWKPGDRLVTQGSAEFEAGLYAGIKENAPAQQAWLDAHVAQAHLDPFIAKRPQMHMEFTALRKSAATTTDLDTMTPGLDVAHDVDTPIQGLGEEPPLAGRSDAAAPAGAAPYNGAEPFGVPVAPDPGWVDPRQRRAAFQARVAQNLQER